MLQITEAIQLYQLPISLILFIIIFLQVQKIKEEIACINGKLTILMLQIEDYDKQKKQKRN